jgi:hypothetical protein
VKGFGAGALQSGIRLNASCSPFDVVPPELYAKFKATVLEQAKQWGLRVCFGQDDGSIAQAEQRFWQMERAHLNGRLEAAKTADG